jgi:hypothetical protein
MKRRRTICLTGLISAVSSCWLLIHQTSQAPARIVVARDVIDLAEIASANVKAGYEPYFVRENYFPKVILPAVESPPQTN